MKEKSHIRNRHNYIIDVIIFLVSAFTCFKIALAEVTITSPVDVSTYYHDGNMISLSGTATGNISTITWSCESGCTQNGTASGTTSWFTESFYLNGGSNNVRVTALHSDGSTTADAINVYYTIPSGTDITLPYSLNFDSGSDSLEGLISATKGAVVRYEDSLCWRGGCARVIPSSESNSYAALGGFNLPANTNRIHVRYLVYYGPDFVSNLDRRHKNIIIHRESDVSGDRGMIYVWRTSEANDNMSLGACDNTDCRYEGGKTRPDGTESFLIADHLSEWVSLEAVFDTNNHMVQLYITTQDGNFINHLLAEKSIHNIDSSLDYWSRISVLGAYIDWGTTPSPEMYWLLDEIAMSSSFIGPPDGFVTGTPITAPSPPHLY
jgi:hypothetical protein